MKNNDLTTDRWVVSTPEENEEARKKGLYKSITSFGGKRSILLAYNHVNDVVYLANNRLQEEIKSFNRELDDSFFGQIECLLHLLEDFFPYYLGEDFFTGTTYTVGNEELFKTFHQLRNFFAFPPTLEKFYMEMEKRLNSNRKEQKL